MLYLDQTRNRRLFMAGSIIATVAFVAVALPGINAVGIIMAAATLNILVYYAMPDRYSKACRDEYPRGQDGLQNPADPDLFQCAFKGE